MGKGGWPVAAWSRLLWRLRGSPRIRQLRALPAVARLETRPAALALRRALARAMAVPAAAASARATAHGIERYTVFHGVLRIAGWLQAPAPVSALALSLPGGATIPLRFARAEPGRITFDQRLPVASEAAEVAAASLAVTLADGTRLRLDDLGAAEGDPAHALSGRFQAMLAERAPGLLLEVGSRARSGFVRRGLAPPGWAYSGFDIMDGPNVDVVGDAHQLARHYPQAQFDAVMAFSVLEHLLMPWKFVLELNQVLKPGGIGLFTTHQAWPLHDQPWDFWRFSDTAWTALLNPATGFEIVEARMGEPAFVVAQRCSAATAFAEEAAASLASFVLFRKIGETSLQWPVELDALTATRYPPARSSA